MNRALILLAALLFAGAWIGEAIIQDSGYVLIAYKNTSIETSLWVMAALLLLGFALIHWLLNVVTHFRSPVQRLRQWSNARSERKAQARSTLGLKAAANGDWWKSRRLLAQAGNLSSAPTLFYIEAARMAAKDGDDKECRNLLELAASTNPDVAALVQQISAELDIKLGHAERARITLEQIIKKTPNNAQSKALLCEVLEQQQAWPALAPLIPELRKSNIISEEHARKLRRKYATAALNAASGEVETLNKAWEALSFEAQQEISTKLTYIRLLSKLNADHRIEQLLKGWLNKQWDEELILIYSELRLDNSGDQLLTAKNWYKTHPESAALELCLARLSRTSQLWGAAIQHYRKSLALEAKTATQLELVQLYLQLGEIDDASALLSSANSQLNLPAPNDKDRSSRLEVIKMQATKA